MPKFVRARPPLDDGEAGRSAGSRVPGMPRLTGSERARIVALSWDGLAVPAIAGQLGCHPNKVRRWLHRFNADGIDGLGNPPRCRPQAADHRGAAVGHHRAGPLGTARAAGPRRSRRAVR